MEIVQEFDPRGIVFKEDSELDEACTHLAMEVAPPSDFSGVGPGQSLGRLLSVAARARKNASRCGAKHIDVKIGDQFLDTHGWLKKDQVKKNARFTTVATTFLEPKKPC